MSRLALARRAVRAAVPPRVLLSGPPGGAVQMVGLDLAARLADRTVVVDAGDGACLDFAELYAFDVVHWPGAHSALELAEVFADVTQDTSLLVDNFSAWWGGLGGLRDVGHVSGWEHMRGQMSTLVRSVLACAGPVVLIARADIHTAVEVDGAMEAARFVSRGPFLDEQLIYPWPLVLRVTIDADITVEASRLDLDRGPTDVDAVLDALTEWRSTGAPVVDPADAEGLVTAMTLDDRNARRALKRDFAASFGAPSQLPAAHLEAAQEFIARHTKGAA